jgi:hypothetical protein
VWKVKRNEYRPHCGTGWRRLCRPRGPASGERKRRQAGSRGAARRTDADRRHSGRTFEIGLGRPVKADDLQWQPWAAATASSTFMRRDTQPDVKMVEAQAGDQSKRDESVNVVRYGVASLQTIQK